ncbi:MAG: hypothetical protein IJL30_05875 [Clostridia bacterium]|nr:hypothetical protein [Clostridia bacterium]
MIRLTSHERLMRIFRGEDIDRPALKLWGAGYTVGRQLHEKYRPVSELAAQTTDIFTGCGGYGINLIAGTEIGRFTESWKTETGDPKWKDAHTVIHTPKGDLEAVYRESQVGDPGYDMQHYIKEAEDIDKILSLPYIAPTGLESRHYENAVAGVGDRGVAMIDIPHAAFLVQCLTGSETLAYLSVDARELIGGLCSVFSERLCSHVKNILETGIKEPIFCWVGPELFLPPLMSPKDFEDFVYKYDKPVCDIIHDYGGYVWVHSHGKVRNFIDSFIDMGVDVLNPLEPGPNGDVEMNEVVEKYGGRIGLEGNIEIQEILLSTKERIARLIDECVAAGEKSGRFILCPSAGYMEYARPTENYIENLLFYLKYGLETVEKYRR